MKKCIRVVLAVANPLRLVIAVISSILVYFPVRCLAADQPTALVAAQDGAEEKAVVIVNRDTALLFYQQDGKPIGIDYLAKGTELPVDSKQDDRLFVRYKDKLAYIKKDDVRPKEGSLGAEQLFKASAEHPIRQSDHPAQQEQAPQPEAQQQQAEVLADLDHKAFTLWSEGKARESAALLRGYSGPMAAETAKVRELYANTYEAAAAPKPPAERIH